MTNAVACTFHDFVTITFLFVILLSLMTSLEAADSTASGGSTNSTNCQRTFVSSGCKCAESAESEAEGETNDPSLPTNLLLTCRDLESAKVTMRNLTGRTDLTVSLTIAGQRIERLSEDHLQGLAPNQLIKLHLDQVGLSSIEPNTFIRPNEIDKLTLTNNLIRILRPGAFRGLQRLTVLLLSGNPLYAIDANVFTKDDIPMISVLELDRCRIVDFAPNAMSGLGRLNILNLSSNNLDALPVLGEELDSLTELNLSHNYIKSLESKNNISMSAPGPEVLRLDNNLIERLTHSSVLSSSPSVAGYRLTELVLNHNAIESIEVGSLSGCPRLSVVDLSNNRLTAMDSAVLSWPNITRILIHDNPWNCSVDQSSAQCSVNAWMVTQSVVIDLNIELPVTCASPPSQTGKDIYTDHVLDVCAPSNSSTGRQPAALYVCLTILICLLLLAVAIVIVSRRRRRRAQQYRSASPGHVTSSPGPTSSSFGLSSPFSGWRKNSTPKRSPSAVDGHDDAWSSNIGYRQMVDLGPGSDRVSADVNEL